MNRDITEEKEKERRETGHKGLIEGEKKPQTPLSHLRRKKGRKGRKAGYCNSPSQGVPLAPAVSPRKKKKGEGGDDLCRDRSARERGKGGEKRRGGKGCGDC